jgi:membrane-bound lytic murein transglycosylase B
VGLLAATAACVDAPADRVAADAPAVAAPDPAGLAHQIMTAEATIDDPDVTPAQVAAAGRLSQVADGSLVEHPGWDAAVAANLPGPVAAATRNNVDAGRSLLAMSDGPPATRLPAWHIVDPGPPEQLHAAYDEASRRFGVPWTVLAAINLVETRMGRIVGNSGAGAQGPMQFEPETWARFGLGGDVWHPRDAILGAANYLRASGAVPGNDASLDRAIWRYNNDERYVRAVRDYAANMQADQRAFLGYHAWRVFVSTEAGTFPLPTGYDEAHPLPLADWLARQAWGETPPSNPAGSGAAG